MREISRNSTNITIANLWENIQLNKYNLDPKYQRKSIWSEEKQSFFIDSILKNYPIPPIFLKQNIDNDTGRTTYDVVDGKQRIISLIKFINNEIPVTTEKSDINGDSYYGLYFDEFINNNLMTYKRKFWSYPLPIEYIDTEDKTLDDIFDRLNRNGEPLSGQELRKAKYHDTKLQKAVEDLALNDFWMNRLNIVDKSRMEDHEFIAELIFMQLQGEPLHSNQATIDEFYQLYSDTIDIIDVKRNFYKITKFIIDLNLNFEEYKISGTSHLYGIWCLAFTCIQKNIDYLVIKKKINEFYADLKSKRGKELTNIEKNYKLSMSARTKDKSTRLKRLNSLLEYLNIRN